MYEVFFLQSVVCEKQYLEYHQWCSYVFISCMYIMLTGIMVRFDVDLSSSYCYHQSGTVVYFSTVQRLCNIGRTLNELLSWLYI